MLLISLLNRYRRAGAVYPNTKYKTFFSLSCQSVTINKLHQCVKPFQTPSALAALMMEKAFTPDRTFPLPLCDVPFAEQCTGGPLALWVTWLVLDGCRIGSWLCVCVCARVHACVPAWVFQSSRTWMRLHVEGPGLSFHVDGTPLVLVLEFSVIELWHVYVSLPCLQSQDWGPPVAWWIVCESIRKGSGLSEFFLSSCNRSLCRVST